jgi:acyltransferase
MSKGRLEWLDIAKGLGIIAVTMDHTVVFPSLISKYLSTFHMPLFFFLSGYLFSPTRTSSLTVLVAKKMKSLIVPYLFLSVGSYLWWLFEWKMGDHSEINVFKPIIGTFLAIRDTEWTNHTGALWFLPCLFITELLFFCILRVSLNRKSLLLGGLVIVSLIGTIYHYYVNMPLLWNIDAALMVVIFYGLGFLFKEVNDFKKVISLKSLILLVPISLTMGISNEEVDLLHNTYGNYLMFYFAAISGLLVIVLISKEMKRNFVMQYLGRNSLVIFGVNPFILAVIRRLIILPPGMPTIMSILIGVGYTIVTLLISVPIIYIINNYFPFILGKRKMKNSVATQKNIPVNSI